MAQEMQLHVALIRVEILRYWRRSNSYTNIKSFHERLSIVTANKEEREKIIELMINEDARRLIIIIVLREMKT
jgi:hypothetical protein